MAKLIGGFEGWQVYEESSGSCQSGQCGCRPSRCGSITNHLRLMRKLYPSQYIDYYLAPAAVAKLLQEQASAIGSIGTGPWPDADDTGDPPSTKRMGWDGLQVDGMTFTTPKKQKSCGAKCCKCKTFNEYAEPNQKDGSYICYECR